MKRPTLAQAKKLERLYASEDAARTAVFAFGPNRETRFYDCYQLADEATKHAYNEAMGTRMDFQRDLVSTGRGWLDNGIFRPYT